MDTAKLLLLGESAAGKTCLIRYRVFHQFDEGTAPTMPVYYFKQEYTLTVPDKEPEDVILNIWDTAGQERYRALTSNFFRLTRVALLVGDVTSKESMDKAFSYWLQELRINAPESIVFFAASKYDLVEQGIATAAMTKEEIDKICTENRIVQWEYTSAKTGMNVDRLFNSISIAVAADLGIIETNSSCVSIKYKVDIEDAVEGDIEVPTVVLQNLQHVQKTGSSIVSCGNKGGHDKSGEKKKESATEGGSSKKSSKKHGELSDPETVDISKKKKVKKDKCC